MNDTLHMLFGAGLVMLGVLSAALADRIRGLRLIRERAPRADSEPAAQAQPRRAAARGSAPMRIPPAADDGKVAERRDLVIRTLRELGYNRRYAEDAVDGCAAEERTTTERWVRAALVRAGASVHSAEVS